ncbi:hypothetical protein OOZ54_20355 [Rhodopseudomonas palustris]|uniref:hypothetical protein n=1 Tax=Rhodopseudomonas palustris TaxID=1076 RepID=UPI0022F12AD2|nr:hypothetical protein [Rhodopseudomonas palustris]WBU28990.1 hypothetical protein OOZ54_20355 [Rhodopseudomonas palustris]
MTIDTWLGLFGAFTGLVGIYLAYHFYIKSIRTKVLGIAYTDPFPLVLVLDSTPFKDAEPQISGRSKIQILFWNKGSAPIESTDFLSPIHITATAPIISMEIHDKDPAASVNLDKEKHCISIELLRPGEALSIVLQLASDTCKPDVNVQMKSADMSTFVTSIPTIIPSLVGITCAVALALFEIHPIFNYHSTGIETSTEPTLIVRFSIIIALLALLIIGIALPITFGFIAKKIASNLMQRRITPVAWKFLQLKSSSWNIDLKLQEFKAFMNTKSNMWS